MSAIAEHRRSNLPHERDYLERTIATVRQHEDADNCWPQWANIFADEIERLWVMEDEAKRIVEQGSEHPSPEAFAYLIGVDSRKTDQIRHLEAKLRAAREAKS